MPAPLEEIMGLLSGAFRREGPVGEDAALAARCAEVVAGNARLSPIDQVDIYRQQYWSRHLESLRDDYAGARLILGDEAFDALCRAYLGAHPPASFTLRDLGVDLVRFADRHEGFPEGKAELARDMIRYEHALVEAFDGPEAAPLDPAKVREMPEEGWSTARIVLHPVLFRMRLGYPVHLLRADLKFERPTTIPGPAPVRLAVFRKDLVVRYEELDPAADALLEALGRGVPLVPACEAVATGLDEESAAAMNGQVGAWFAQWTSWGLIVDIER